MKLPYILSLVNLKLGDIFSWYYQVFAYDTIICRYVDMKLQKNNLFLKSLFLKSLFLKNI